jgi:hypothetical protein
MALCNVTLPTAAKVLYVDPSVAATVRYGNKLAPFAKIDDAVGYVTSNGSADFATLVGYGTYNTPLSFSKKVAIYGGYYNDFDCRDWRIDRTVLTSDTANQPAVTSEVGGEVTLDRLTAIGRTPTSSVDGRGRSPAASFHEGALERDQGAVVGQKGAYRAAGGGVSLVAEDLRIDQVERAE